jgi:serine/threonine protein kinase
MKPGARIGNYVLVQTIGSGISSQVWLAQSSVTDYRVAIKVIDKATIATSEGRTRFNREIALLKQLIHPFIPTFFERLEDLDHHFMVMEYAPNGNLRDFLRENRQIPESQARVFFAQLFSVLEYLHLVRKVAHRDLKADNILLDSSNNIRVIDFGFSKQFSMLQPKFTTTCGSPAYLAPEVIRGEPYTRAADIWSSGVLLYTMVVGRHPHVADDIPTLLHKILFDDIIYPNLLSPPLQNLLHRMLERNPDQRITLEKIRDHNWLCHKDCETIRSIISMSRKKMGPTIDKEIIEKMSKLGFDSATLLRELIAEEFTPLAAIYRQFQKAKSETTPLFVSHSQPPAESPRRFSFSTMSPQKNQEGRRESAVASSAKPRIPVHTPRPRLPLRPPLNQRSFPGSLASEDIPEK